MMMSGYQPKGEMVSLGHLEVYVSRPLAPSSSAVLMFSDIFGVESGRHKQFCDELAAKGFLVVCPDFFEGGSPVGQAPQYGFNCQLICKFLCTFLFCMGRINRFFCQHSWDAKLRADVFEKVVPWMEAQGARRFASVGFCWGSYGVMKCAVSPEKFRCGASFHPSTEGICKATGEDDIQICREVRCPQLVVACAQEPDSWRPGGAAQQAADAAVSGNVWQMAEGTRHGYMTRSDVSVQANRDAVANGFQTMVDFFNKHLSE